MIKTTATFLVGLLVCVCPSLKGQGLPELRPGFRCEIEWEAGSEWGEDDGLFFSAISAIAVSGAGEVFVLDRLDRTISSLDSTGAFLRAFGGEGQGPGEFQRPSGMIVRNDRLMIVDGQTRRVAEFDFVGSLVEDRSIPVPGGRAVNAVWPSSGVGLLISFTPRISTTPGKTTMDFQVELWDSSLSQSDTLAAFFSGLLTWQDPSRPGFPQPVNMDFGVGGAWALAGDSLFAFVDGYTGVIRWQQISGSGTRTVREERTDFEPIPIPPWLFEKAESWVREVFFEGRGRTPPRRIEFHPHPGIALTSHVLFSGSGDLWIKRLIPETLAPNTPWEYDWIVFPVDGSAPFRVNLPSGFTLHAVVGNKFYGAIRTANDVPIVRVLRCEAGEGIGVQG